MASGLHSSRGHSNVRPSWTGGSYCWACDDSEQLQGRVFDREGLLVREEQSVGRMVVRLAPGQIVVIWKAASPGGLSEERTV